MSQDIAKYVDQVVRKLTGNNSRVKLKGGSIIFLCLGRRAGCTKGRNKCNQTYK